jgi:hypothetical protein
MSFQNQSGDLSSFAEVVPEAARVGGLTKSSLLTQRRRCRIVPQTGPSSSPSSQVQFLIADQGGLLDPRSIVLNYTFVAAGTAPVCPDDGHCFGAVQVLLNGQLLDNVQNAMKVANVEHTLGGSQSYYRTAGSMQGFELLSPDGITKVPTTTASDLVAAAGAWGYVPANVTDISARYKRAAAAAWNSQAGSQRSIPLGLMTGFGRCKQYLPISLLGEVALVLQTGSNSDVMFQFSSTQDATYTLANLSLEYDVVVPDARYMQLLQKVAMEDTGIVIPYESTIVATGGQISSSSSALQESSIITSRATNHLLRANLVQIPSAVLSSLSYPSQSCFSHASLFSVQWRIGSSVYPQIAAQGDASVFNTALSAYGSVMQENGTCTNRVLWANSTNPSTAGTAACYEDAAVTTSAGAKFAYADRCIPSFGFSTVKGGAEPLDVDGVSLAGASGSQLITTIVSAPQTTYVPYVLMTALRFIKAANGSASVIGA